MRRTWLAPLTVALAVGLIGLAVASAAPRPDAPATLEPAPVAAPAPVSESVPSVSGEMLAEMTRRQGTPARVAREARRRARQRARIVAKQRAARAATARAAASQVAAEPGYWVDREAASVATTAPTSSAEQAWLQGGRGGWVEASGFARAPVNAPGAIKRAIQAGNQIARSPYLWGGGHGAWQDEGYDCSGSVSYALAAAGMLGSSQTSGQLMSWGAPGPGRWLTIYANEGHVFMYVAGLRFDTSGRAGDHASRWQLAPRSANGFVARHYPGL